MLFEIVSHGLSHSLVDSSCHLTVAEFCLGLSLELRLGHFYRNHGCKSLTEILTGNFHLGFLKLFGSRFLGILLQHTGDGRAEADEMGTSLNGIDIIHIGMEVLAVRGVVHHRHLDGYIVLFSIDINHIIEKMGARRVNVTHKFTQTEVGMKHILPGISLIILPQVS